MDREIKDSIEKIRRSGAANMLDITLVQRLAFDQNMYSLVLFIADHKDEYVRYILYGDDGSKA